MWTWHYPCRSHAKHDAIKEHQVSNYCACVCQPAHAGAVRCWRTMGTEESVERSLMSRSGCCRGVAVSWRRFDCTYIYIKTTDFKNCCWSCFVLFCFIVCFFFFFFLPSVDVMLNLFEVYANTIAGKQLTFAAGTSSVKGYELLHWIREHEGLFHKFLIKRFGSAE